MHHASSDRPIGQAAVFLGVLVTSLPAAFADDVRTEAPGIWFITRASSVELRSAGPDIAQYPVFSLGRGELLRIDPPKVDGDWAAVHLVGPAVGEVRALMPLDPSTMVNDDVAILTTSTPIYAPNLRDFEDDGRLDPRRSWSCLLRLAPGSKVFVTERLEIDGESWAMIAPPDGTFLWVDPSKIRPATAEELPVSEVLSVEDVVEREIAARIAAAEEARRAEIARRDAENAESADDPTIGPDAPGGGQPLARPLDPLPDDVAAPVTGDWYLVSRDGSRVYSRPEGTPGSYTVQELPLGVAVLVLEFEDGSARVAMTEGLSSIRGILEVDDAVEIAGDTVTIVTPTELRTPSFVGRDDDGRPNPLRSYQTMAELEAGESLTIVDRFDVGGRSWLQVEPPQTASLYVRGGEIRPASAEEIAQILAGTAPTEPEVAEPETQPETEPVSPVEPETEPETVSPVEPTPVTPETAKPSRPAATPPASTPTTTNDGGDGATEAARPEPVRVVPPPAPEDLRELSHVVDFPDGVRGEWKSVRNRNQAIRTGPDSSNSYTITKVSEGALVVVVEETDNGWCAVRFLGPALEGVRGLLKAEPGAIEVEGDVATIRRGEHELKAPSHISRGPEGTGDPDPLSSYLRMTKVGAGESLVITNTFTDRNGNTWYEVIPPLESVGWIHRGYLEAVQPDQLPSERGVDDAGRPRFVVESTRPAPVVVEPEVVEPEIVEPEVVEPEVVEPEVVEPEVVEPEVVEPEVVEPEVVEPEVVEPEVVEPEVVEPEVVEPEVVEPEVVEPEVVEPEVVEPEVVEPEVVEPEVVEPEIVEPEMVEPEVDLIETEAPIVEPEPEPEPEIVIEPEPEPEPEPAPAPILSAEMLADVTLADAEAKYEEIRASPENDAEFEAMELIYQAISERPSTPTNERSRAEVRLKQIQIQRDVQRRIDTLRRLENRANLDRERIEAIRQALLDRADYTAIGRLSLSRVYDGRTLPRLYRLEDPTSGRTIAYVSPNDALSIESGVGRIVGIVGTEREDPGYRIRVIRPDRFEIDLTEEIPDR